MKLTNRDHNSMTALHDMACRTFLRPGPDLLVAIDTLAVKRIGFLQDFNAFIITRIMAILAELGLCTGVVLAGQMAVTTGPVSGILTRRMMMAVIADSAITRTGRMGLVIKQNFSGNPFKHNPDGMFGFFGGKGRIAECTNHKQNDGRTIGYLQVFL